MRPKRDKQTPFSSVLTPSPGRVGVGVGVVGRGGETGGAHKRTGEKFAALLGLGVAVEMGVKAAPGCSSGMERPWVMRVGESGTGERIDPGIRIGLEVRVLAPG